MEIVMEQSKRREKILNVRQVIPAGTTVKAVLVSSVDAPCNTFASADPQPVKLRILDDGHLPKGVTAKLKGGIIIASVYGDLSSERVYMRIERLTQVKACGDFIETAVTGFVTGEDGKYGVRGCVVDKSVMMVGNAAVSGFFSGVSQYFQAAALSKYCPPCGPYGAACGPCGPSGSCTPMGYEIAMQGGIQGTCSAFDMLTDYFVKRAEQIRPVIEVTAGRIVDVTFTHNAELGDLYTQEKVQMIREQTRGG
jgi:conjugal transfer pilus assembly protein TraB